MEGGCYSGRISFTRKEAANKRQRLHQSSAIPLKDSEVTREPSSEAVSYESVWHYPSA